MTCNNTVGVLSLGDCYGHGICVNYTCICNPGFGVMNDWLSFTNENCIADQTGLFVNNIIQLGLSLLATFLIIFAIGKDIGCDILRVAVF